MLPGLTVLFQRPADIVVSVRDGSVDFGITGIDVIEERKGENGHLLILHDDLGFGACSLRLAVPESWADVNDVPGLAAYRRHPRPPPARGHQVPQPDRSLPLPGSASNPRSSMPKAPSKLLPPSATPT